MQIKEMFAKKIDREIQGVIIVGQGEDSNVSQELEEYVVTRELQKHFADFYSAYKKGIVGTTPKMGVWISGFFGSGKSHFLKILSYLLENRQVGSRKALDYFIEDKKIVDSVVLADMKLAAETPADVILFNIDSKSESTGKQNKDAIVNVFLKVFKRCRVSAAPFPMWPIWSADCLRIAAMTSSKLPLRRNTGSRGKNPGRISTLSRTA